MLTLKKVVKQIIRSRSRNAAHGDDPVDINRISGRTFNSSMSTAMGYSSPSASWPSIVSFCYATSGNLVIVGKYR